MQIVLIAASTPRSFTYLTAMTNNKLILHHVYILDDSGFSPGQRKSDSGGNMAKRIEEWCLRHSISYSKLPHDVNSPELLSALRRQGTPLAVYSGYGGKIVGQPLLKAVTYMLHIHSGLLPKYRGSTTIYYSILNKDRCGVTAILLDGNIDTGIIVGEKESPPPAPMSDIDYEVDSLYRAELLVEVLTEYQASGTFPTFRAQALNEGNYYYIAHPILRHIAKMRST